MEVLKIYKFIISFSILIALLSGCKKIIQYSLNEIRLEQADKNLNEKNINRLNSIKDTGSFRFAVIGDTQRAYDELDDFVNTMNDYSDISFIILNGDITDFGLNREYLWMSHRLQQLEVPFFAVIGNHDMLANGRLIYREMFGKENFSFDFGNYKFICLNSNSREVGYDGSLPDINWLQEQVTSAKEEKGIFVFSHVPPFDLDFDPALSQSFHSILSNSGKVSYSIHAHRHSFSLSQPYGPPVNYLVVDNLADRNFVLIDVALNNIKIERVYF